MQPLAQLGKCACRRHEALPVVRERPREGSLQLRPHGDAMGFESQELRGVVGAGLLDGAPDVEVTVVGRSCPVMTAGHDAFLRAAAYLFLGQAALWAILLFRWATFSVFN